MNLSTSVCSITVSVSTSFVSLSHSFLSFVPPEVKRQKSIPEDLRRAEEDRGSPTELDIRRPFEEEVCHFLSPNSYLCLQGGFKCRP